MDSAVALALVGLSVAPADADGWIEVTIPIENIDHAADQLMRLGAEVEVLSPTELRAQMARTASALAMIYGRRVSKGPSTTSARAPRSPSTVRQAR